LSLKAGCGSRRTEAAYAGLAQIICEAGDKGGFGADNDQGDIVMAAKVDDVGVLGDIEVKAGRVAGDAWIAGRAIEVIEHRAAGEGPGQCVFSTAAADEKYVHDDRLCPRLLDAGQSAGLVCRCLGFWG